jgi:ABC-2 type transport system ATP-binding protein
MTGHAPVVRVSGIGKVFGSVVALDGVDLHVDPGEVFGLLGPNGAGKSTMVKILTGLVHPSSGEATVLGQPAGDPEARRRVGYLPELFRFPQWLTGRQLLAFHGELAGVDKDALATQIPEVLEQVGMNGRADRKIATYSKGMSQRIGLAQALLGSPQLVLLDEPTSALDPVGRREVRDLIRHLRKQGVAVLLNSHLLGEVEHVCDRIAVLDRGRVIFEGTISNLTGGATRLEVRLEQIEAEVVTKVRAIGEVEVVDAATMIVTLGHPDQTGDVAAAIVGAGGRIRSMIPVGSTLEDVFVDMVDGGER